MNLSSYCFLLPSSAHFGNFFNPNLTLIFSSPPSLNLLANMTVVGPELLVLYGHTE